MPTQSLPLREPIRSNYLQPLPILTPPTIKLTYLQNVGIVLKETIELLNANSLEKYSVMAVVEKRPINGNALGVRKIET